MQNRTHFFGAVEYTDENQFFTVNAGGRFPQYEGTFLSDQYRWTYTGKVDHQISQNAEPVRPRLAGGRVPPDHHLRRPRPPDQQLRLRGAARLLRRRPHLDHRARAMINDVRVQYAYAKYEVAPPYSHGSWEPGYFGDDRLDYCTAVFNYPSLALGGCGNSQMGPEKRWQFRDDLGWTIELGGSHQCKTGVDLSVISFRGDNLGSPLGTWTFPRDAEYNANDRTTYPTQWTSTLPTFGEIPVKHFATYVQDDWQIARALTLNLGLRYDVQFGSYNEDLDDLLGRIGDKLGPTFAHATRCPIPFHRGRRQARRPQQLRAARRPGVGRRPATAAPTCTPATACSTTTCGRCRTSAS